MRKRNYSATRPTSSTQSRHDGTMQREIRGILLSALVANMPWVTAKAFVRARHDTYI